MFNLKKIKTTSKYTLPLIFSYSHILFRYHRLRVAVHSKPIDWLTQNGIELFVLFIQCHLLCCTLIKLFSFQQPACLPPCPWLVDQRQTTGASPSSQRRRYRMTSAANQEASHLCQHVHSITAMEVRFLPKFHLGKLFVMFLFCIYFLYYGLELLHVYHHTRLRLSELYLIMLI